MKVGYHVGSFEKISYGLYFLGQNVFYGLVGINVQTFFADRGITVAVVSLIVLLTKIWDAVNDALFGVIIDKVRFKKGRYLPWLRVSLPPIAISSIFLFAMPLSVPMGVKILWGVIGYVAWDMSYTLCDVPIFVLPMSMTDNIQERSGILSLGRYMGTVGIMGAMLVIPMLQNSLGWTGLGIVFSIIGVVTMLPICFKAKERNIVRPTEDVTLKQMAKYVAGNKYLLIFYLGMLLASVTNFTITVSMYFARYNLGNQNLASVISMFSMIPMMVVGAFVPALTKRFDKFVLYRAGLIFQVFFTLIRFFVGYGNFPLYVALNTIGTVVTTANGILLYLFTPDCIEYGTYHTGERSEGVATSIQTFMAKLTGSLSASLGMLVLGFFGFVSGENAAQPDSAVTGIWLCNTIFPAIGLVLQIVALSFYKLRDKDVQVMAEYNIGKVSKADAEAQLKERYGPAADLRNMTITRSE